MRQNLIDRKAPIDRADPSLIAGPSQQGRRPPSTSIRRTQSLETAVIGVVGRDAILATLPEVLASRHSCGWSEMPHAITSTWRLWPNTCGWEQSVRHSG
jgi:hypothetical protein